MKLKKRLQAILLAGMMALTATAAAIPSFTTISAQAEDTNNDDWLHAVGSRLYDKDGNELVQLPRTAIEQMTVKNGKITIPWEGKEYKIIRNPFDNEKEVREMLNFYSPENSKWIAR